MTCEGCSQQHHSQCSGGYCECKSCWEDEKLRGIIDAAKIAADLCSTMRGGVKEKMIPKPKLGNANFLKPEFVQSHNVTEVVIASEAKMVTKEWDEEKKVTQPDGTIKIETVKKSVERCSVEVIANDDAKSHLIWEMNPTSQLLLVETLSDNEKTWVNKMIPITVLGGVGINESVYPEKVRFAKLYPKGTLD